MDVHNATRISTRTTPAWPDARILEMAIIVVAFVFVTIATNGRTWGDTAFSRLATVVSLTEHGTWYINRPEGETPNFFEQRTIDKVMIDDERMLSSKPPILPLIMTAEYIVLNRLFGWDLSVDPERDPEEIVDDRAKIVHFMSYTLIGGAYLLTLIFFLRILRLFIADGWTRAFCLVALAFGTQLWGYGTNINNHVPGACLLVIALYYSIGLATKKLDPTPWRFFAFGFAGGLVPTIDMPAAIFVLFAGIYLVVQLPKPTLIYTSIGAAIPLAVHFGIMLATTGSLLPVQTQQELYRYEASYWRNPRGIDALNEPKLSYFFHMMIGRVGLFSLFPVTFLGIIAVVVAARRKDFPYRNLLFGGAGAFAILTAYYVASTNNYGGEAFGFRWYIIAMPVLLLMAAPWVERIRGRWAWLAFALMLGVSFYSAYQCAVAPWGSNNEWTVRFLGRSYEM